MVGTNPKITQMTTSGIIKRQELVLFSDRLPRDNPLILRESFPQFKEITKAELNVTLSATNDLPLIGWRLTEIRVNNKTFAPSNPLRSSILIQNINTGSKKISRGEKIPAGLKSLVSSGENKFEIFRDAPFGTGIIGDQIFADVRIILEGTLETNPIALGAGALSSISSNIKNFEFFTGDKIKQNTPLAIAGIIAIVIILVLIAIIVSRASNVTSDVKETAEIVK